MPYSTRAHRHDRREPEQPPDRILHYDPRSLHRTETPVAAIAVACARCFRLAYPDEVERDNVGNLVCQDKEACEVQQDRNERGGW